MRIINTAELTPDSIRAMDGDTAYWVYNGLDCAVTYEILEALLPNLDDTTRKTYEFSLALQAPVLEMNMRGVLVNQRTRSRIMEKFRKQLAQLEEQFNELIYEGIGIPRGFNWRSPKQLGELLYDVMCLPEQKKRNTAGVWARSTDEESLNKLTEYFIAEPLVKHLLHMRMIGKALGFLEGEIDNDGRMRTSFNIAGTNTGRFSSAASDFDTGGNLQNVDRDLRSVFCADPGWKFANLDLEQADSRNLGALCWNSFVERFGEPFAGSYLAATEAGDLHTYVCKMCNPQLPWGSAPDRQIADSPLYRNKTYRDGSKVLGHGCLTRDHEVLTPTGWVPIWQMPDTIMTWSEGESKFDTVSAWSSFPYTGELSLWSGGGIEVEMTHDHRVPSYMSYRSEHITVTAAEAGPQYAHPKGGYWKGGSRHEPRARLLAIAHARGKYAGGPYLKFEFESAVQDIRFQQACKAGNTEWKWTETGYRVRGLQHLNQWDILNWDEASIYEFLEELNFWKGDYPEVVDTVGYLLGEPMAVGGSKISWTKRIVLNEPVFCPTVPSTFFFIRRDGVISVTGNSNYLGTPPTMAKHSKFPVDLVRKFQTSYFGAFPVIPEYHKLVRSEINQFASLTTLFGRRRYFFGRPTDDSTIREAVAYSPQSMTADEINTGILELWRANRIQLLVQVHDSILFQYREEEEDEIIPWALEALKAPLVLKRDRPFVVPTEAKIGWNWGEWSEENPDGLKKWKGSDARKRVETETKLSIR